MKTMPVPMGGYKPPSGRMSAGDAPDAPKAKAPAKKTDKAGATKKTGETAGKSNKLGMGGRAAQLREKGVPEAVIGAIARSKGAAPGGKSFHGGKGGKAK